MTDPCECVFRGDHLGPLAQMRTTASTNTSLVCGRSWHMFDITRIFWLRVLYKKKVFQCWCLNQCVHLSILQGFHKPSNAAAMRCSYFILAELADL